MKESFAAGFSRRGDTPGLPEPFEAAFDAILQSIQRPGEGMDVLCASAVRAGAWRLLAGIRRHRHFSTLFSSDTFKFEG